MFYDHDLIVNVIQGLSPSNAILVIYMLRISNIFLFQNVFSATIEAITVIVKWNSDINDGGKWRCGKVSRSSLRESPSPVQTELCTQWKLSPAPRMTRQRRQRGAGLASLVALVCLLQASAVTCSGHSAAQHADQGPGHREDKSLPDHPSNREAVFWDNQQFIQICSFTPTLWH